MTTTPAPGPRGHRPPPRPVEVVRVERVAPRFISVTFGGDALTGFATPAPTAHVKVFLPDAEGRLELPTLGPDGLAWPEHRPTVRTYTPRRFDPQTQTLEVLFLLHEAGPATTWAASAKPGDPAAIGGPGGRFQLDGATQHWWIGGDESALPAIGTLLEALPSDATAEVHLEVADAEHELPLPEHPGATSTWHHRRSPEAWGAELEEALRGSSLPEGTRVWAACEAAAVRRIRAHALRALGVPRELVTTRGYWLTGESNHPDHDYGED